MSSLDLNKDDRTLEAVGGGMVALAGLLGQLQWWQLAEIDLKKFKTFIAKSAATFILAALAKGDSADDILRVFVKNSFAKRFRYRRSGQHVVLHCRCVGQPRARLFALTRAMYECPELPDLWRSLVNGFPPGLCIPTVNEHGDTIAFASWGSYLFPREGGCEVLGGPPKDIASISIPAVAIPGVIATLPYRVFVGEALGEQAVNKLSHPDNFGLDGGLAANVLGALAIDPASTWAVSSDGPNAMKDRADYQRYVGLLPAGTLPGWGLVAQAAQGAHRYDLTIDALKTLAFDASPEEKLEGVFQGMDSAAQQDRQRNLVGNVPNDEEIYLAQRRLATLLDVWPPRMRVNSNHAIPKGEQERRHVWSKILKRA